MKSRNPPATRRRRIRQRASTNLRGRAASRSASVQPPSRLLRSLCEPTVHPTVYLAIHHTIFEPTHPHHSPIPRNLPEPAINYDAGMTLELIPLCTATVSLAPTINVAPDLVIGEVTGMTVVGERINATMKGNAAADWL